MLLHRLFTIFLILAAVLAVWVARDLSDHSRHSLREFDPHEVARLENDMWRAYYDHHSLRLFADLVTLLRQQYHLPFWRACVGAYHAARAAVVFQRGHNRSDYGLALPDLVRYYTLVRQASTEDFPVQTVSQEELEWWIVHRQRDHYTYADLARTLAVEQAAIFRQPESDFAAHAQARAEAMRLCDNRAALGSASEADWAHIGEVLDSSWSSLHTAVRGR